MPANAGPWVSLLAILLSGGTLGVLLRGWLERRGLAAKASLDEATAEQTRTDTNLAPMERIIASLTTQSTRQEQELTALRQEVDHSRDQMDAALDRIAMLRAENREWSEYHLAVRRHLRLSAEARVQGVAEPDPPEPPQPRTEFSRRSDAERPPA